MKPALRLIGIVIAIFVAIFMIGALLLPSQYEVERSIIIDTPQEKVYTYTVNLRNREKWNPWSDKEQKPNFTFKEGSTQVGDSYTWEGEDMGKGRLTITELNGPDHLASEIQFLEPFENKVQEEIHFEGIDSTTKVRWVTRGELPYPFMRWFGLNRPDQIGEDFEEGLKRLKQQLEN